MRHDFITLIFFTETESDLEMKEELKRFLVVDLFFIQVVPVGGGSQLKSSGPSKSSRLSGKVALMGLKLFGRLCQ